MKNSGGMRDLKNLFWTVTICRGSFVFHQSRVEVSASLTNVGSIAVGAFDLVNCCLSVVGFISVFNVGQYISQRSCTLVGYTDVVRL